VNNVGTTIGPLLVSFAIFGTLTAGSASIADIESVKIPYLVLGAAFIVVALIFKFSSIPDKIHSVSDDVASDIPVATERKSALKYPQLVLGMIGIFVYVGVEVSTASNLPEYMRQHLHIPTDRIAPYISLFWASLMIGRWTSRWRRFDLKGSVKNMLSTSCPTWPFGFFWQ
jgi:FHS family L-fucose permease-like MFS transporter